MRNCISQEYEEYALRAEGPTLRFSIVQNRRWIRRRCLWFGSSFRTRSRL